MLRSYRKSSCFSVSISWFDITCVCVTQGDSTGCCERSRLFCLERTRASRGESRWAEVHWRVSADVCRADAAACNVYCADSQRGLAAVSISRYLVTTLCVHKAVLLSRT